MAQESHILFQDITQMTSSSVTHICFTVKPHELRLHDPHYCQHSVLFTPAKTGKFHTKKAGTCLSGSSQASAGRCAASTSLVQVFKGNVTSLPLLWRLELI